MKKLISFILFLLIGVSFFYLYREIKEAIRFKPLYQKGHFVVYYTKKEERIIIDEKSKIDDFFQFVVGRVIKTPQNENDTYKIVITENYQTDLELGKEYTIERGNLYSKELEFELLEEHNKKIREIRFKMSYQKISNILDSCRRQHLAIQGPEYNIKKELEDWLSGDFLGQDILKITRVKKSIETIQNYLADIFKINEDYYHDYKSNVVEVNDILEIEISCRKYPFGINNNASLRMLKYLKYSKVSLEKIISYIYRFHKEGLIIDLDYFIDEPSFEGEKDKLKKIYAELSDSLKKNDEERSMVQNDIQGIQDLIKTKQNKYDRTKNAFKYASDFSEYLSNELKSSGLDPKQIDQLNISMEQLNIIRLKHKEKIKGINEEMNIVQKEMSILEQEKKVLGENLLKLTSYRLDNLYQRFDIKNRFLNVAALIFQGKMDLGKKSLREILIDIAKVDLNSYENEEWFLRINEYSPKELNSYFYMAMVDGMTYDKVLRRNDREEEIQ